MAQVVKHQGSAHLLVTSEPRELSEWSGSGESRVQVGRLRDAVTNTDISRVDGVLVSPLFGVVDVSAHVPDDLAGIEIGSVVTLSGDGLRLRLAGGDYGKIRTTVQGVSDVQRVGEISEMIASASDQDLEELLK